MSWKKLKLIGLPALLLSACGNLLLDASRLPETFHVFVSYPIIPCGAVMVEPDLASRTMP